MQKDIEKQNSEIPRDEVVENFVEGKFCEFVAVLSFWDTYRRARFEGCFGSSADNMVHSVQKVNSVL